MKSFFGTICTVCLLTILFEVGCDDQPSSVYYRDHNKCLRSLHSSYTKIAIDVIETSGKNTLQTYSEERGGEVFRPKCPVTGEPYLINTNFLMWKDLCSSNVAIICPKHHPSMSLAMRKYLAFTFSGNLIELSELPVWASSIEIETK